MSTCYPTRFGYNLCKSYIDIYIGLYMRHLAQIHSAGTGEAVCRAGSDLRICEFTVSIMRVHIQFV